MVRLWQPPTAHAMSVFLNYGSFGRACSCAQDNNCLEGITADPAVPVKFTFDRSSANIQSMKILIQRVKHAQVDVAGKTVGKINQGILALVGVERDDTVQNAEQLLQKMCRYRIFPDADGKMNLSLNDNQGELLLVSQFTLVADTKKGNRPGFSRGASPAHGELIFNELVKLANNTGLKVQTGQFGADMQVGLINDGPVTFWLESK